MEAIGSASEFRRAWFSARFADFDHDTALAKLGELVSGLASSGFSTSYTEQLRAWQIELRILSHAIAAICTANPTAKEWALLLEFEIPRRQRRVDAVVLAGGVVVLIEFKVGSDCFPRRDCWQLEDYALDLRDYHEASQSRPIIPILVATDAIVSESGSVQGTAFEILQTNANGLARTLLTAVAKHGVVESTDLATWANSEYRPSPTIVEAAQRLFAGHSVAGLSHHYADNLDRTVNTIVSEAVRAQREHRRTICFVTGVPGAGKTLAGLEAVHRNELSGGNLGKATFLSGNGPLVRVLREALTRDAMRRGLTRKDGARTAAHLVQSVHGFVEVYGIKNRQAIPHESVVVYDEAQRGWDRAKVADWHGSDNGSEAQLILDAMARKADWSVVIALVGCGQEIHAGEAGLEAWGTALSEVAEPWRVVASPEVLGERPLETVPHLFPSSPPSHLELLTSEAMHLAVSVRCPRARHIAEWVDAVLRLDRDAARKALKRTDGFRLGLTRCVEGARAWLRDASRGERRPGLLASSGALRHRAYGLELDPNFLRHYPIPRWFLDGPEDVRSSYSLEVALREFDSQGLEIDFVGLCWGDDLTITEDSSSWRVRELRGSKWRDVRNDIRLRYCLNKYRVLLTRAREGLVICVPRGDAADHTRDPSGMDRTAEFLTSTGLPLIDS